MEIQDLLDMLDEMVNKSWSLPLSGGRSVIDAEKAKDLIYDIRTNLPREIREAQQIKEERNMIIINAKKEAEMIIRSAEEKAKATVANVELVRRSQEKATEILTAAQQKAREMQKASFEYAQGCLETAENSLMESLTNVRNTRVALKRTQQQK